MKFLLTSFFSTALFSLSSFAETPHSYYGKYCERGGMLYRSYDDREVPDISYSSKADCMLKNPTAHDGPFFQFCQGGDLINRYGRVVISYSSQQDCLAKNPGAQPW